MSYGFINARMKDLFSKSATIQGRFYILPKYMQELNGNDLEQCIASAKIPNLKDGPLVAMMPPVAFGNYRYYDQSWSRYVIVLYFLRTSYTDENGVVRNASPMNTSQTRLDQDWDAMKLIAVESLRVLDQWFKNGSFENILLINKIRFYKANDVITPVSLQGNDRRSGVKVVTQVEVAEECDITEYSNDAINSLINTNII